VLDAKFSCNQKRVADALTAVHAYRDGLRWNGNSPGAAFSISPALEDHVAAFADLAYLSAHRFGSLLAPPDRTVGSTAHVKAALIDILLPHQ